MTSPSIFTEEVIVDRQCVSIPRVADWISLSKGVEFEGFSISPAASGSLVVALIAFASKHESEFCLGMYRPGKMSASWLPLLLFRESKSRWRRVQLERQVCGTCGWAGATANTTEPSLYFGVPNELEAIRDASLQPRLGCPSCGKVLPRAAIWVENDARPTK